MRVFDLELNADHKDLGVLRFTNQEWRDLVAFMQSIGMVTDADNAPTGDDFDAAGTDEEAVLELLRRPSDTAGLPTHKLFGAHDLVEEWEIDPAEIASALAAYRSDVAPPAGLPDLLVFLREAAADGMRVVRRAFIQVAD